MHLGEDILMNRTWCSRSSGSAFPGGLPLGGSVVFLVSLAVWLSGCQLPRVTQENLTSTPQHSVGAGLAGTPAKLKTTQSPNTPGFLKFPHKTHVVDQGVGCTDCHAVSSEGKPGMPDHDVCSTCHEVKIDTPDDSCGLCHVYSQKEIETKAWMDVAVVKPKKVDEFNFNHSAVAADAESCIKCHKQASTSMVVTDSVGGTHATLFSEVRRTGGNPDNCALCHTTISRQKAPSWHQDPAFQQTHGHETQRINEGVCATCHTQKQCQTCHQQTKPQSHQRPEWPRAHGKVGTFDQKACLQCHSEQACKTCHNSEMPRDHTNFFRRRSHGKLASWNRDRCMVCHKQDFCEACHIGAAPIVPPAPQHVPGVPCLQCHSPASPVHPLRRHGPLPEDSCLKCHRLP